MKLTKYMSFFIKDGELLKKFNEIWEIVSNSINKEFDSKPVYNRKYLKTKVKFNGDEINTNFHDKGMMPKESSHIVCISVILIDSVFKIRQNCYPKVFLEECKYIVKEKEMSKYIDDN